MKVVVVSDLDIDMACHKGGVFKMTARHRYHGT